MRTEGGAAGHEEGGTTRRSVAGSKERDVGVTGSKEEEELRRDWRIRTVLCNFLCTIYFAVCFLKSLLMLCHNYVVKTQCSLMVCWSTEVTIEKHLLQREWPIPFVTGAGGYLG